MTYTDIGSAKFKSDKEFAIPELDKIPEMLHDNIMIEPVMHNEISRSSLILPDNMKLLPRFGRVLAVGTGKMSVIGLRLGCGVEVDDVVVLRAHYVMSYGHPFSIDGKVTVVIPEQCVFGVLNLGAINKEYDDRETECN